MPKEGILYFSDSVAGLDSKMATFASEPWPKGEVQLFAFYERSLDSLNAQVGMSLGSNPDAFDGGLKDSIRPRVLLAVSGEYRQLTHNLADLEMSEKDWAAQIGAWSKQRVVAHLGDRSNRAIYWNGRLQNVFASFAEQHGLRNVANYSFKEFSWYLQGASFGEATCVEYVQEMMEESLGELQDPRLLREAYLIRGLASFAQGKR